MAGDIPEGVVFSDAPVVAYASLNDFAGNFGHALFDFLFPVFNMLQLVSFYTPAFQLLLAQHQVGSLGPDQIVVCAAGFLGYCCAEQCHACVLKTLLQACLGWCLGFCRFATCDAGAVSCAFQHSTPLIQPHVAMPADGVGLIMSKPCLNGFISKICNIAKYVRHM